MSDKFAILGMLRNEDLYGYEITKRMKGVEGFWYIYPGNLYKALNSLVKEHMIETKETEEHQGKLRKIYRITEKGKIEFDKWLSTPALPIITRHEAYLKIWLASNDIEKIRIQLQQIHDYSKNILQLMDSANMEKFTNYVKWMMDVGKKHVALDVEWSESCLAKLAEIEKKDKHHD